MTLDPTPDNATLLRMAEERTGQRVNGVELGAESPLRARSRKPGRRTGERVARRLEHDIQVALFDKIDDPLNQLRWPALAMCFAVPNGGHRMPAVAAKLKASGTRAGVPDIMLPVARGGYHGLVIEMKRPGGTTSPEQAHWMAALAREGWKVALHTNEDAAFHELTAYLDPPLS